MNLSRARAIHTARSYLCMMLAATVIAGAPAAHATGPTSITVGEMAQMERTDWLLYLWDRLALVIADRRAAGDTARADCLYEWYRGDESLAPLEFQALINAERLREATVDFAVVSFGKKACGDWETNEPVPATPQPFLTRG